MCSPDWCGPVRSVDSHRPTGLFSGPLDERGRPRRIDVRIVPAISS
jgi:hypothetical protein